MNSHLWWEKYFTIDDDKYYFLCLSELTEDFLVCAAYSELTKKYGKNIVIITCSEHEFLMDMCRIPHYYIIDKALSEKVDQSMMSNRCKQPTKGKIYVCNPFFHREIRNDCERFYYGIARENYIKWYLRFLKVNKTKPSKYSISSNYIKHALNECSILGDVQKVALICPDSFYLPPLSMRFWESLVLQLREEGIIPLCYCEDEKNRIKGTEYLRMSIEDAVAIAHICYGVYSARNGLCDVLVFLGKKLHVFYSSYEVRFLYGIDEGYGIEDVDEQLILSDRVYY